MGVYMNVINYDLSKLLNWKTHRAPLTQEGGLALGGQEKGETALRALRSSISHSPLLGLYRRRRERSNKVMVQRLSSFDAMFLYFGESTTVEQKLISNMDTKFRFPL